MLSANRKNLDSLIDLLIEFTNKVKSRGLRYNYRLLQNVFYRRVMKAAMKGGGHRYIINQDQCG